MSDFVTLVTPPAADFSTSAANWLAEKIKATIASRGRCTVGLSGGSTPREAYAILARTQGIAWDKVTIFLADERHVPHDHNDANAKLLQTAGLTSANLPGLTVLLPDTNLFPDACATAYGERISALLYHGSADVLTLGVGDDGHIASLFPPVAVALIQGNKPGAHTTTEKFATRDRITLTLPLLSNARNVLFLLKGEAKKKVWDEMMSSSLQPTRWPAHQVLAHGNSTLMYAP